MKQHKYFEAKFQFIDKALQLQAAEYERRLSALNGEAERLRNMQAMYVPRETFDTVIREFEKKIEILTAVNLKGEGRASWVNAIPWIISIVGLFLMYYLK